MYSGVQRVEEGGTWPLVWLTNKKLFHICARLVRNAFVFIVVPREMEMPPVRVQEERDRE